MSKATEKMMGDLHGLTANVLIQSIKAMLDGTIEPDPKLIANAIKFLRDNNIECTSEDMEHMFRLEGITLPRFEQIAEGE